MPLAKRADCADARFAGYEVSFSTDIEDTVDEAQHSVGFDFVIAPLTIPSYRPQPPRALPLGAPLAEGPSDKVCYQPPD